MTLEISQLTLERGFARLAPNDVTERAEVGRSTFYAHFSGLDDLLAHSLDKHLSTLAECTLKPELDAALVELMEHFWEQRAAARTILQDQALVTILRSLAGRLEVGLLELSHAREARTSPTTRLVAVQLSAG